MADSVQPNARILRLLVVEDEALIAMMLEDILEDLGHEVIAVAASVSMALRAIESRRADFDAAILDANLNGASASPIASALRAAEIPFLLASGYEGAELRRLGFGETALRKPYRREDVRRALAPLCL
jgi:DNA-binding response OmpR family regulator